MILKLMTSKYLISSSLSTETHEDPISSFYVKLLTDRQTDKQINTQTNRQTNRQINVAYYMTSLSEVNI